MTVLEHIEVFPSYARGFTFTWAVAPEFAVPGPWSFWVQSGATDHGPWTDMSPELLDQFAWQYEGEMLVPKDQVLFFRVKMVATGTEYVSSIRTPYGDLSRRDFLQAREIMRNEAVQAKQKTGILGQLWSKSIFGKPCPACTDPITHDVINPDCEVCDGTGIIGGYHGPYSAWMTFSPAQRNKQMKPDGMGIGEDYVFQVRMIGCIHVKKDDVLVDPRTDKRYYVNSVSNIMELRRVPLIQMVEAREAPTSEQIYKLGE